MNSLREGIRPGQPGSGQGGVAVYVLHLCRAQREAGVVKLQSGAWIMGHPEWPVEVLPYQRFCVKFEFDNLAREGYTAWVARIPASDVEAFEAVAVRFNFASVLAIESESDRAWIRDPVNPRTWIHPETPEPSLIMRGLHWGLSWLPIFRWFTPVVVSS